ncbi:MAG: dihydroorotase [Myxococcaceae bacterium]|nr:dihydroorotase [Myxococcaceae bacterium]
MAFDLLVRGGTLVTPAGRIRADLGISGERIAAVGALGGESAREVVDAGGLHVLPGAIDSQVHLREPGNTHKEDLASGTLAAACGGVTSIFEMPNTSPPTTTAETLAWKVERAKATAWVDFAFYLGATRENAAQLGALEQAEGCCGVKCFLGSSTGTLLLDDPEALETVMRSTRRTLACHSEDEARLKARKHLTDGHDVQQHPVWRDEACAVQSTERLLALAKKVGRRVHVLHVTTAGELPLLIAAKDVATFEVTPQHLTLTAPDCYAQLGTLAQMNPPLREARHRDALWAALRDGHVTVLGTDHAPHTLEEKAKRYPESPSGMPGVETLLPVMLTHVAQGRLTLERLVDLLAWSPARVFGLADKGRLEVGAHADLALVDLTRRHTLTARTLHSRCGWTPYEGFEAQGRVELAVLRGAVLSRLGQAVGAPRAAPLRFR